MGVIQLTVIKKSLYKKGMLELWFMRNIQIHTEVCMGEQRFYLFHVNIYFH
jgi:hypothetical protein